jgi:hypothetical protein
MPLNSSSVLLREFELIRTEYFAIFPPLVTCHNASSTNSRLERALNTIFFSCGNCDNHKMSAPQSTCPTSISRMKDSSPVGESHITVQFRGQNAALHRVHTNFATKAVHLQNTEFNTLIQFHTAISPENPVVGRKLPNPRQLRDAAVDCMQCQCRRILSSRFDPNPVSNGLYARCPIPVALSVLLMHWSRPQAECSHLLWAQF